MRLQTTLLLALAQCLIFTTATPIPETQILGAPLHAREFKAYYNSDDSGALYKLGTAVRGTDSFRDADGIYHQVASQHEKGNQVKRQPIRNAFAGGSADTGAREPLWTRAQAALLAVLKPENAKRKVNEAQGLHKVAKRDGDDLSMSENVPGSLLDKIDKGERIYF